MTCKFSEGISACSFCLEMLYRIAAHRLTRMARCSSGIGPLAFDVFAGLDLHKLKLLFVAYVKHCSICALSVLEYRPLRWREAAPEALETT
jgi:hypothetical protein